jgi:hypothetical protein
MVGIARSDQFLNDSFFAALVTDALEAALNVPCQTGSPLRPLAIKMAKRLSAYFESSGRRSDHANGCRCRSIGT